MKKTTIYIAIPLLGALMLSTACEPSKAKKSASTPAPAATAPTLAESSKKPEQPKVQDPVSSRQDPVDALIAQSEKEYQKGQSNYRAGHLEAARDDFDRAFNMLLQGPADVHSDDRLERQFDKIVEAVNGLEMQALKEGDGFTEQNAEPAPIDEANDVTFPVDPNVKAKAEAELRDTRSDLPLVMNDQVASFINYFSSKGRGTLEHALARSGRYREMISRVFKEEGVPQDLIYLAQAESGFHPLALSRAGARGMWQFMASRASGYGLERNWWVDERQDPEKATRAAARHLKDLYNQFGDWYLAMAAYNSGPGTVQKAVQRTGYADFWELYRRNVLPGETRNYVPIIVAVTIMAKNPAQYSLEHITPELALKSDKVTINYPVDLRLVSEIVDTSVANLQELNPALLRLTTPKDQAFDLHLPVGTTEKFQSVIASIPQDMRVWWRYHRVQSGETLSQVANKYHVSANAIAEANGLQGEDFKTNARLIIPVSPGRSKASGDAASLAFSKRASRYKVRKGDTVLSVADDFGVPVERLRKWNRLKGNSLTVGRTLTIFKPVAGNDVDARTEVSERPLKRSAKTSKRASKAPEDEEPVTRKPKISGKLAAAAGPSRTHKVKRGETLTSIASRYETTVDALRRDNRKVAANLRPGAVLVIKK